MRKILFVSGVVLLLSISGCGKSAESDMVIPSSSSTETEEVRVTVIPYTEEEIKSICLEHGLFFKEDEFEDVRFYESVRPADLLSTKVNLYLYMAARGNSVGLRGVFRYHADDWIFFDTVYAIVGDNRYEFSVGSSVKRDVWSTGTVSEYADIYLSDKDSYLDFLDDLVSKKSCKVKLKGSDGSTTYTLSEDDIDAIVRTYDAYTTIKEGKSLEE